MKKIIFILIILVFGCKKYSKIEENELKNIEIDTNFHEKSKSLLIEDEDMAIKVVEIYLFRIYGKDKIIKERPYKIGLINNYWYIEGSFNKPQGYVGGVFEILINAKNGKVIYYTHGK